MNVYVGPRWGWYAPRYRYWGPYAYGYPYGYYPYWRGPLLARLVLGTRATKAIDDYEGRVRPGRGPSVLRRSLPERQMNGGLSFGSGRAG